MKTQRALWLVMFFSLAACRKDPASTDKKADPKTATVAAAEDERAARPEPAPVDEGIDVPTEEDFEDAVTTQITEDTDLKKELDSLEKQIGQ